jgi:hypothetical protein
MKAAGMITRGFFIFYRDPDDKKRDGKKHDDQDGGLWGMYSGMFVRYK